jgi:hypothetical protein
MFKWIAQACKDFVASIPADDPYDVFTVPESVMFPDRKIIVGDRIYDTTPAVGQVTRIYTDRLPRCTRDQPVPPMAAWPEALYRSSRGIYFTNLSELLDTQAKIVEWCAKRSERSQVLRMLDIKLEEG